MATERTQDIKQFHIVGFNLILLTALRGKSNGQFIDDILKEAKLFSVPWLRNDGRVQTQISYPCHLFLLPHPHC